MAPRFHAHAHLGSCRCQSAIELLGLFPVPQSSLLQFPAFSIDKRNLLEARVIVTTYNQHVRLLSPEPWLVGTTKVYSGLGADIVMESLRSLTPRGRRSARSRWLFQAWWITVESIFTGIA